MSTKLDTQVEHALIEATASGVGLRLDGGALNGLAAFAQLFLTWNERINLGGDLTAEELVSRHFLDAFAAARFVEHGRAVVDVGSGGGLPAVPLALARPDIHVDLFEPTGKKVSFLRTAIRELGLKPRVDVRAERLGAADSPRIPPADVAMSRATWAPAAWLAVGRGLIHPDGTVLVFGTGGSADPPEAPPAEWRYAAGRRLMAYRQAPASRST